MLQVLTGLCKNTCSVHMLQLTLCKGTGVHSSWSVIWVQPVGCCGAAWRLCLYPCLPAEAASIAVLQLVGTFQVLPVAFTYF